MENVKPGIRLAEVQLQMKGRLKELWKPLLQITHGLEVHNDLFTFVEGQRNERLTGKQNTLEGHIVKVVVELFNQAKKPVDYLPFQGIWMDLVSDLDGRLDEKKPHVMDTSEFFKVTKNKVGYRLREILSGKTTVVKERDSEGDRASVKAYIFDEHKLKRVAKKYGYELSTKLPSLLSSEGVSTPKSMEKAESNNVEKEPYTPQELGRLSNSVDSQKGTSGLAIEDSSISKNAVEKSAVGEKGSNSVVRLEDLKAPYWADSFFGEHECCICGYVKATSWRAEDFQGKERSVCEECVHEWERRQQP